LSILATSRFRPGLSVTVMRSSVILQPRWTSREWICSPLSQSLMPSSLPQTS
jgi:hypothetical protein